jgi:ABC-type glycerol-3-phosphate transport system substrate-binding protein
MRTRLATPAALLVSVALVVAACGTAASPSPSPSSAAPPSTPTETAGPSGPASEAPGFEYPTGDVHLTMFGSDEEPGFNFEQGLIDEYIAMHPNVTVDAEQAPLFPSFDALTVQLPAGEGPTIFQVFEPWTEIFYSQGFLEPANPAIFGGSDHQVIHDLYLDGGLDAMSRDGTVYMLPNSAPSWSLLINNRLFEEAGFSLETDIPSTWDEVAAMQDELRKEEGGRLVQKGFEYRYTAGPHWMAMTMSAMIQDAGGEVVDENGDALLTSDAAVEAMETWRKNVVEPSVSNNVQPSPYQDFADEQDVMSFGGANAISFVERLNPEMEGNITVAHLPTISGNPGSIKYSFSYAVNVNASDDEKLVAWDLIKYMTDHSVDRFLATGSITARKEFQTDSRVTDVQFMDIFLAELENGYPLPRTTHWTELQNAIAAAVQRVAFENVDPRASLEQAQQEYEGAVGS